MVAWILVTPLAATGILVAHAAAYGLTGTPTGPLHAYLDHVPQIVAVLATIGLVGLALQVPVALLCVLVARRVAGTLASVRPPRRPPALADVALPLSSAPALRPLTARPTRATGRSPPALLAT